MKMRYIGYLKTNVDGCNVHNGETVEVNDEMVEKLNPSDWEEIKSKSKKTEVVKDGKDLEIKRNSS